jgi:5-methylcytosine-specific restriction endonuclease McrA
MPLRSCTACGDLVALQDYDRHRAAHTDAARPSARARGYGTDWEGIRAEHLEREPWCRFHLERGLHVRATEVDHILSRRRGGSDDHSNLRSSCKPCHSRRTAIDQSGWGGAKGA